MELKPIFEQWAAQKYQAKKALFDKARRDGYIAALDDKLADVAIS